MKIGGRKWSTVLKAIFHPEHYVALFGMMRRYDHPFEICRRYLFAQGSYPFFATVKTPVGRIQVKLYSHHDLLTLNEIFCRQDYPAFPSLSTVVDFGSNIGISALYFLTRNDRVRVKLYEPLPSNLEKLRETLKGYEGRFELFPVAVGTEDGEVLFGYEPSGRYGGIDRPLASKMKVPCRSANAILSEVLRQNGFSEIDILKVDIEGLESRVVESIHPEILRRVQAVYAEIEGPSPRLDGFRKRRYGPITQWTRESP